ncbi:MAG: beta-propeller fold lactonase family protein [Jejuia sp.]
MVKKRIKYIILVSATFYALFLVVVFIIRLPSYTIKTSGHLYIVNKLSRNIQVFDLFSGKEIADIPIDMQSHEVIATSDQTKVLVTNYGDRSRDGLIKIIDTKTNKIEKVIDLKGTLLSNGLVSFQEPDEIAVIDYFHNDFAILDIDKGDIIKKIATHQKNSHLAVLHPKKRLAYVTNMNSNSVSVIDLGSEKLIKVIPCGLTAESIDITPSGKEVWVTNKNGNSITIIETKTNTVIETLACGKEPIKIKFSIDGKYCLVANATDGNISVYDQKSKKEIKKIMLHGKTTLLERVLYHTPRPVNILMHPNGMFAFIANSNASKIEVIDMQSFEVVSTIGTGEIPDALAFVG